jgi:hypothetical protein
MLPAFEQNDDIVVESRTQSVEAIKAVLEGDNYAVTEESTRSDKPAEAAPAKPKGEGAAETVEETEEIEAEAEVEAEAGAEAERAGRPKLTGAQRSKRTRERLRSTEAEVVELRRQLAEKTAAPAPAATPAASAAPAETAPEPKARPNPDDFSDGRFDPSYEEALLDWHDDERERKRAKTEETTRQAETAKRETDTWAARVAEEKTVHPDYDEVIRANAELPISLAVHHVAKDSPRAAGVLYWLATNPEEAKRIFDATLIDPAKDSPRVAARKHALAVEEVEKIEEALAAPPPKEQEPATNGAGTTRSVPRKPVPVEQVAGRSGGNRKSLSQMSPDELRAMDTPEYIRLYKQEFGRPPY